MRKAISYLLTLCIVMSLGLTSFAESEPAALKPGDIIEFGAYEQDNITGNGPEPIEWQVLDVDGDEAFLVSVHSLDGRGFNETRRMQVSWEDSDIRKWLNQDFIDTAFSDEEKASLVPVDNETVDHSKDLVFLISNEEVKKYFSTDVERICEPTEYAYIMQGGLAKEKELELLMKQLNPSYVLTPEKYPKTYILRSVVPSGLYVNSVLNTGFLNPTEEPSKLFFIRPAIRIDMSKAFVILGKINSRYIAAPVTDPDEIDFLRDMASGINKRLLSTEGDITKEQVTKLVAYELDAISKYESVSFPDPDFDEFAHDYIDACQLQQKALESFDNKDVFEPLWGSGRILRAELIAKGYEKYGLDIREEDYLSYKNAITSDNNSSGGTGNGPSYAFLEGYWSSRNGMHTFEMKSDHSYVTTIPVVPQSGDTFELVDGVIYKYFASSPGNKTANLKFTKVSDTEIEVYSYQTKTSYTLIKRR